MASDSYPRPGFNSGIITELLYERLVASQAPDGLIGHPSDPSLVYADGVGTRMVRVRANRLGLVRGFQYDSGPTDIDIQLPANTSGTTRVDLIVLRLDRSTWRVKEDFIVGIPGGGAPTPLAQEGSGYFDLPVAMVTVPNNAGILGAGAVTNLAWYIGPDGNILCTDKTRPPFAPPRSAFETNTKRWIVADGTKWTAAVDDSGVASIALENGYTATLNKVQRRNGTAVLALKVSPTTGIAASPSTVRPFKVGQLPAGFLPTFEVPGCAQYESTPGLSFGLRVTTAGGVYVDLPVSVQWNANRPVAGSLPFHVV